MENNNQPVFRKGRIAERIMAAVIPAPKPHPLSKVECSQCKMAVLYGEYVPSIKMCMNCADAERNSERRADMMATAFLSGTYHRHYPVRENQPGDEAREVERDNVTAAQQQDY